MAVLLSPNADGRLRVRFSYNATLVELLKETVPSCDRAYDPASKTWTLEADWGDAVKAAFLAQGVAVSDARPPPAATLPVAVSPRLHEACQVLCVQPDAPVEVAEAAYKALARRRHPDAGGSTEAMQVLNDAIQTFKAFTEVVI
jgi:hypothetical protein